MEYTWFILISLLLAVNVLATVLTEGAPAGNGPSTAGTVPTTVVTQEPVTIPFVKVCTSV